jgi:hypothetical protein
MFDRREEMIMSTGLDIASGVHTTAVVVGTPWASNGRMARYAIRAIQIPSRNGEWTWLARAPYSTWRLYGSWEEAAVYVGRHYRETRVRASERDECD